MIDGALYRAALARMDAWSEAAEVFDREQSARRSGAEHLKHCFELSDFLLSWAPAPTSLQLERLDRDRAAYQESLRAFESWRASGKP